MPRTVARAAQRRPGAEDDARRGVYAHKLFAPAASAGVIARTTLLDRVRSAADARVVVLQGPAGHGKSTALQQFRSDCEGRGWLTGWLVFDEADNDVGRFALHMQALLAEMDPEPGIGSSLLLNAAGDPGRRRRADWLIDWLLKLERPVALFLDDFQALSNPSILRFFRGLFERAPDNTRIFVGTRSVPDIGMPRLLAGNRALLLRGDELRFSQAETAQFFAGSHSLAVSRSEVEAIHRRTEGWPAALQLFRLALASPQVRNSLGGLDSCRPRELAEYLADNVLALQEPHIQDFLLRTSLLNRLTAPLCDAVTGGSDAQDILLRLEGAGLFVHALDQELRWFRYHPLFSSILAEQLRASAPACVPQVHARAAAWHRACGQPEEAMHHFVACGETASAADVMNDWCDRLVASAQLATVETWYSRLPFAEIASRPDLAVKAAYALVFLRRRDKLPPLLDLLQTRQSASVVLSMAAIGADDLPGAFRIVGGVPLTRLDAGGFPAFELGAAANLQGYDAVVRGDFDAARDVLVLARAFNERGDASFSGGYTVGVYGVNLIAQGRLAEALDRFRQGFAEQRMHLDGSLSCGALVSCYIWALYEANQLDLVEALFAQYHDIISEAVLLDFLAVAYLAMARTHDARGRPGRAMEVLEEAESIGHVNGWARLQRLVGWERVRRQLLSDQVERAQISAQRIPANPAPLLEDWMPFSEDLECEGLGRIRLDVRRLDLDRAAARLAHAMSLQPQRVSRQIRLQLLDAQLQAARGIRSAAHRCLRRALQLAREGGFIRMFLDEGEPVLQLLREEYQAMMQGNRGKDAQSGADRAFLEQLLQASGTDLSHLPPPPAQPLEALTDREREILEFLANGVSNREMASRIFVSENTVKFHLKNIYSKLSVGSRLQAITAARQLGLIH